jgi:hypothetical protein
MAMEAEDADERNTPSPTQVPLTSALTVIREEADSGAGRATAAEDKGGARLNPGVQQLLANHGIVCFDDSDALGDDRVARHEVSACAWRPLWAVSRRGANIAAATATQAMEQQIVTIDKVLLRGNARPAVLAAARQDAGGQLAGSDGQAGPAAAAAAHSLTDTG